MNAKTLAVFLIIGLGTGLTGHVPAAELPGNLATLLNKEAALAHGRFPIVLMTYASLGKDGDRFTEREVQTWADAGYNLIIGPGVDITVPAQKKQMLQILDWAHARGLRLFPEDRRIPGWPLPGVEPGQIPADYADRVRSAAADFGAHPGTIGFFLQDEAVAGRPSDAAFFACYRLMKETAPKLTPWANLAPNTPGDYLTDYAREAQPDFFCFDRYDQMASGNDSANPWLANLLLFRQAALRHGIPYWAMLLCTSHYDYEVNGYDDLRWQFNTALACGAHGIAWYQYYMREPYMNYHQPPVDWFGEKTPIYFAQQRLHQEFHRRYGDLFTRLVSTRVTFYPEAPGDPGLVEAGRGVQADTWSANGLLAGMRTEANGKAEPSRVPLVIGEFADARGQRYVMVVNHSRTDNVRVWLTFPGNDVRLFSWDWNGNEQEGNAIAAGHERQTRDERGLTVLHWLRPGQETVYRVASALATAEPIGNPQK